MVALAVPILMSHAACLRNHRFPPFAWDTHRWLFALGAVSMAVQWSRIRRRLVSIVNRVVSVCIDWLGIYGGIEDGEAVVLDVWPCLAQSPINAINIERPYMLRRIQIFFKMHMIFCLLNLKLHIACNVSSTNTCFPWIQWPHVFHATRTASAQGSIASSPAGYKRQALSNSPVAAPESPTFRENLTFSTLFFNLLFFQSSFLDCRFNYSLRFSEQQNCAHVVTFLLNSRWNSQNQSAHMACPRRFSFDMGPRK